MDLEVILTMSIQTGVFPSHAHVEALVADGGDGGEGGAVEEACLLEPRFPNFLQHVPSCAGAETTHQAEDNFTLPTCENTPPLHSQYTCIYWKHLSLFFMPSFVDVGIKSVRRP